MNHDNLSVPEPMLRARVAIIRDQAEAEREISNKNFRNLMVERRSSYRLKEHLLWSLIINLICIAMLIRILLGSGDINIVGKVGFTICLLFIATLPAWRLHKLLRKRQ